MSQGRRELKLIFQALTIDLGNRNLALLGLSRLSVSFSNWCFAIALGVYGFEAHGAVGVGLVAVIRLLPGAVTAPFAGLLSDRHPRRTVMLWSCAAMGIVLAGATIAAAAGAPPAVVFVFPALFAVAASGYGPAESALSPVLARTPQELSAGNVTHSALETGGFFFAALLTGLLLHSTSTALIFGIAAAATLLAAALLSTVTPDRRPHYDADEDELAGVVREIRLGLDGLREHPGVRLAAALLVLLVFFEGFAEVIVVVMALHMLHLSEGSVGFLNATWGLGALIGGAGLALLIDRSKLVIAIAAGSLLLGAAAFVPAIWPVAVAAYVGWAGLGAGYNVAEVAAKTLLQRLASDETLGRARREADDILGKARRQAEQITSDARARAESLERDAQERHRQAMGSLVQQREELERRVDDLRAFEREYRSRLKAYLEGQMRDLEAGATDSGAFPAMGGPDSSVSSGMSRMEARNGQPSIASAYAGAPEPVSHGGFHPSDGSPHDHR